MAESLLTKRAIADSLKELTREKAFDKISGYREVKNQLIVIADTLKNREAYRALGVNRLSIGTQSFVPEELRLLGRIHLIVPVAPVSSGVSHKAQSQRRQDQGQQ